MSKREAVELVKDGYSIFLKDLEGLGYLPEAVVNWVALMGWSYDDHTEFFTMQDLIEKFSLDRLNPSPAAINFTKLDHFNGLHIRNLEAEDLANRLTPFFENAGYTVNQETLLKIIPILQMRIATLDEAPAMAGFFFRDAVHPQFDDLVAKGLSAAESADIAAKCLQELRTFDELKTEIVEPHMRQVVENMGYSAGQVFGILRVAVTGQKVSPPLFESMEIIGRDIVFERIEKAIQILQT